MAEHLITPPPELVQRIADKPGTWLEKIVDAYRAGADQELEACEKYWMTHGISPQGVVAMRYARRPQPPSLKEQALIELGDVYNRDKIDDVTYTTIRLALEQLDD